MNDLITKRQASIIHNFAKSLATNIKSDIVVMLGLKQLIENTQQHFEDYNLQLKEFYENLSNVDINELSEMEKKSYERQLELIHEEKILVPLFAIPYYIYRELELEFDYMSAIAISHITDFSKEEKHVTVNA